MTKTNTKASKKKNNKKEVKKVDSDDLGVKYLTVEEMNKLDQNNLENQVDSLKQKVMSLEMALLQENQKTLKATIEITNLKTEKLYKESIKFGEKIKERKQKHKDFNKDLKIKHKLVGDWGFNPDSGKIIEGND